MKWSVFLLIQRIAEILVTCYHIHVFLSDNYMAGCCPKHWLKFFKAVCDEPRQGILMILHKYGKLNAGDIVKKTKLSQPTVSHHLKVLTEAKAILAEKKGKEVFYSLAPKHISNCCGDFAKFFCNKPESDC